MPSRRLTRHFGVGYDFQTRGTVEVEPVPDYLLGRAPRLRAVTLTPSAYVLSGSAWWSWQHSIHPVAEDRCSVTFRQLARAR